MTLIFCQILTSHISFKITCFNCVKRENFRFFNLLVKAKSSFNIISTRVLRSSGPNGFKITQIICFASDLTDDDYTIKISSSNKFSPLPKSFVRLFFLSRYPANIYLLTVNNKNTRKRCKTCSKLTIKTPKRYQLFCFNC